MKYTLKVLKAKYLGNDVYIPLIELKEANFEYSDLIIEEIKDHSGLQIFRQPLWQYLEDDRQVNEFLNYFFSTHTGQKIKKIPCILNDYSEMKKLITPYGEIELPKSTSFNLYSVVSENDQSLVSAEDTVFPILYIDRKK